LTVPAPPRARAAADLGPRDPAGALDQVRPASGRGAGPPAALRAAAGSSLPSAGWGRGNGGVLARVSAPRPGLPEPWAVSGRAPAPLIRTLGDQEGRGCPSPAPGTHGRPAIPVRHLCDEGGTRALRRSAAAGEIPLVPRPSPRRGRRRLQTCVGQARVVCTWAGQARPRTCLHAGIAGVNTWSRCRSQAPCAS
jgi:hypothetical protein